MGLIHPTDLDAWRGWQQHQQSLRWARRIVRPRPGPRSPEASLWVVGDPQVLVALDATSTSMRAALLDPLAALGEDGYALLVERRDGPLDDGLMPGPAAERVAVTSPDDIVRAAPQLRAVLGTGHYLPIGGLAHRAALALDAEVLVVQHGLLTPFAPPLPPGSTLLAWSAADAEFWASGRRDVRTEVVGSQLLWRAATQPAADPVPSHDGSTADGPTYLGQLHGAELSRWTMARAARRFCAETGAVYRPHPAERDALSRMQHAAWERRGIVIDRHPVPLGALHTSVVGVFSTGVLEAAAAGRPAWVHLPDAPAWVRDLWARYDLRVWGGPPTAPPPVPEVQPSHRIAELARAVAGGAA